MHTSVCTCLLCACLHAQSAPLSLEDAHDTAYSRLCLARHNQVLPYRQAALSRSCHITLSAGSDAPLSHVHTL